MTRPIAIVMVKTPRPGRVKTRLARDIGTIAAAQWQRRQTRHLLHRLAQDARFDTVLAVAPDQDAANARLWPPGLSRWPQGGGDLGARIARMLRAAGPRPAVLIGSDIPAVTPARVWAAFRALGAADAVFGPAPDGGYWLIGLHGRARRAAAARLSSVRWSSPHTLADSKAALRGFRIAETATLWDVDSAADLRAATSG